jgi:LacI family transcriptional regulator
VDQTTVSACLSNSGRVKKFKPELRARILREAKKMNYRPHFFATQLRNARPRMILLAIGTLQDLHAATIAEAFTQRMESQGYRVIISVLDQLKGGWEGFREIIGPQGIHDICLITRAADWIPEEELISLLDEGLRVTMISRGHADPRVMEIRVDEEKAGRMAYEHLYRAGHRKIWILDEVDANPDAVGLRARAAVEAARDLGAPAPLVISLKNTQELDSEAACTEILNLARKHGNPEAILAVRDRRAYGAILACEELGLKVGRDVSVIGHDDIWPSHTFNPPLTTIRQPVHQMGNSAAMLMLDAIDHPPTKKRILQFDPEVVERKSVRRTAAAV